MTYQQRRDRLKARRQADAEQAHADAVEAKARFDAACSTYSALTRMAVDSDGAEIQALMVKAVQEIIQTAADALNAMDAARIAASHLCQPKKPRP